MSNQDHRPQVTVEQLLRLKRSERPTDEFWTRFERELRQKQLAALVEKRPWWQQVPQFLVRRTYLPIGATAILAFTLVSVKYYAPTELARVDESAGSPAVAVADNSAPARAEQSAPAPVVPAVSEVAVARAEVAAPPVIDDRVPVAAPAATSVPVSARDAAALIAWSAPAATETNSPSARNIAANIARLEQTEPDLVSALNGRRNLTPRVQTASQGISELATVATNTSKRGRLLAQFNDRQFTPEPQAPEIVRERLARRLADPELVDRFSRIGLKGDQVSLKF